MQRLIRKKFAGTSVFRETCSLTLGLPWIKEIKIKCDKWKVRFRVTRLRACYTYIPWRAGNVGFWPTEGANELEFDSIGGSYGVSAKRRDLRRITSNLEFELSRSSRPTACRRPSCCPWSSVKGDWSALVVSWGRRWELVYWSPTGWSTPWNDTSRSNFRSRPTLFPFLLVAHQVSPRWFGRINSIKLELMELENIVANTVYLKARESKWCTIICRVDNYMYLEMLFILFICLFLSPCFSFHIVWILTYLYYERITPVILDWQYCYYRNYYLRIHYLSNEVLRRFKRRVCLLLDELTFIYSLLQLSGSNSYKSSIILDI